MNDLKILKTECTKISEDEKTIHYVVKLLVAAPSEYIELDLTGISIPRSLFCFAVVSICRAMVGSPRMKLRSAPG